MADPVNQRTFVQILPESTGDRVTFKHAYDIEYNTKTLPMIEGETIIGATSGTASTITLDTPDDDIANTGVCSVILNLGSKNKSYAVGENLQVNGQVVAVAGNNYCMYVPVTNLVSYDNPKYGQIIDKSGAAYTRFADGSPQFDAFGKLQTSQAHKIAEYIMGYDELPNDFTDFTSGTSSLTHNALTRGVTLQCGIAAGDLYRRCTDEYHTYQAGISQLIEMTAAVGDSGKTNVRRRWGYYDGDNGLFFENDGVTNKVVVRSKTTGSVVNTEYNQSDWNHDRADGGLGAKNISGINLDISKDNIYWIDVQWLGAGSVRFGIVVDGVRHVLHSVDHSNTLGEPYMSTGSLPVCYEQENTGIAGSTSELKFFCASVKTEGTFNPLKRAFTESSSASVTTSSETPIMAMRSSQTYKTYNNRSSLYPNSFSIHNAGADPILFTLRRGGTAAGGSWVSHGGESTADLNLSPSGISGGKIRHSKMVGGGETVTLPFPAFEQNRRGLRRGADITTWVELCYAAQLLNGADIGGTIYFTLNWDEVRD